MGPMDGGYQIDPYMQQNMQQPGYPAQHAQHAGYQQYGQPQQQYMNHDPNFGYNMGGHPQQGQQWFDSDL
jgi:hypothetical protein